MAVINLQKAVFDSAEIKKADADMQATFKPRQDKIETAARRRFAALTQQLQTSGGKLIGAGEADMTAQGQQKQRELQRMQDDLQADATPYRNDVLPKSSAEDERRS